MSEANKPNNPAEEQVLKAFRDGEREVIVHPNGIPSRLPSPQEFTEEHLPVLELAPTEPTEGDWQGEDAIIHAHFLRNLFLGSHGKFDPQLVIISCARIKGVLDLSYCESLFSLSFFWCIFSEGIFLQAATIPELSLRKCLIGQSSRPSQLNAQQVKVATEVNLSDQFKAFGEVNLAGANIGGQLVCDRGHFEKDLRASYLVATEVNLSDQFKAFGEVNLSGASIAAQLSCSDGHFEKGLIAQHLRTGEDVFLNGGFKSNGEVALNGANIGGQLVCDRGYFEKGLKAYNLKTGEDVCLKDGFKSNAEVDLGGADIGRQLISIGGHFEKGLKAQNLKAGSDVILEKVSMPNGELALSGANIGGQLVCFGGSFEEGLRALRLKTGTAVSLMEGFESKGEVNLHGANIGGHLACSGGYFGKGLKAQHLKTGEDVFLDGGFKSNGEVALNGANIGRQLICIDGHFEKGLKAHNLKTGDDVFLSFGFDSKGEVNLHGANIGGRLDCTGANFQNGLVADGLRYQSIELGDNWEKGLTWLRQMRGDGFQPYEQLMTVYRRMGHTSWARRIGFELEKERHKRSRGLWRAWHSVLKWTIGYGYKPFRSLWGPIVLLSFGAILSNPCPQMIPSKFTSSGCAPAFLVNEWIPSEGIALSYWREKGRAPQGYPDFQPFVYFLEATFPVLSLGQLDKWHPDNALFQWARWILAFIGSVLLAISTLFRVGFFFPDWQSKSDSS